MNFKITDTFVKHDKYTTVAHYSRFRHIKAFLRQKEKDLLSGGRKWKMEDGKWKMPCPPKVY